VQTREPGPPSALAEIEYIVPKKLFTEIYCIVCSRKYSFQIPEININVLTCVNINANMCVNMSLTMCVNMSLTMCVNMSLPMCVNMSLTMCVNMSLTMCVNICKH
jgi:hypothetical protein